MDTITLTPYLARTSVLQYSKPKQRQRRLVMKDSLVKIDRHNSYKVYYIEAQLV